MSFLARHNGFVGFGGARPLGPAFDPASLFAAGEQGAWYDPSDLTTMYQDDGITPAAVDSQVGLILDKRLGVPVARRNRFTFSEFPNGLADASVRLGLVSATTFEGVEDGTGLHMGHDGATNTFAYKGNYTAQPSSLHIMSALVRMDDGAAPVFGSSDVLSPAIDFSFVIGGNVFSDPSTYVVEDMGGGLYRVSGMSTVSDSANLNHFGIAKRTANSARTFAVSGYHVEPGGTLTQYQRIGAGQGDWTPGNHASQLTQARKPVLRQSPEGRYYLEYDGIDDCLVTSVIDLSGTDQATLFTGIRKLRDSLTGVVIESDGVSRLALFAPGSSGGANVMFRSGGTSNANVLAGGLVAPVTSLLTGIGDIAGDTAKVRVGGSDGATDVSDQGTGTYPNGTFSIGARSGGASLCFQGHIYGLILRGAQSTGAEIIRTENWLNAKTGAY